MKTIKMFIAAALMIAASALPAAAQLRFGVRVGTEVNSMHFDSDVFNNDNRAGFTGGVMTEFNIPVINLGLDLSVMYVHRVSNSTYTGTNADNQAVVASDNFRSRDYIEIPLNLKYKIGLPLVGKIVTPYVFTGPSFSILASKKAITEAYENKTLDVAWNFGVGVQLIDHLQIGASYGLGMNKTVKAVTDAVNASGIDGKNNYWTITAAWLF